eukprot:TRINITY_DN2215_c0_g1_i1.p1 TRINITY_DN2215_c0_g1~~TRINITY_DN2215_c0_g1_i1.p1  ORF type:complete len:1387 (-),score=323.36 TRINITY_DN2215_c0_g1_i1:110-4270(-)
MSRIWSKLQAEFPGEEGEDDSDDEDLASQPRNTRVDKARAMFNTPNAQPVQRSQDHLTRAKTMTSVHSSPSGGGGGRDLSPLSHPVPRTASPPVLPDLPVQQRVKAFNSLSVTSNNRIERSHTTPSSLGRTLPTQSPRAAQPSSTSTTLTVPHVGQQHQQQQQQQQTPIPIAYTKCPVCEQVFTCVQQSAMSAHIDECLTQQTLQDECKQQNQTIVSLQQQQQQLLRQSSEEQQQQQQFSPSQSPAHSPRNPFQQQQQQQMSRNPGSNPFMDDMSDPFIRAASFHSLAPETNNNNSFANTTAAVAQPHDMSRDFMSPLQRVMVSRKSQSGTDLLAYRQHKKTLSDSTNDIRTTSSRRHSTDPRLARTNSASLQTVHASMRFAATSNKPLALEKRRQIEIAMLIGTSLTSRLSLNNLADEQHDELARFRQKMRRGADAIKERRTYRTGSLVHAEQWNHGMICENMVTDSVSVEMHLPSHALSNVVTGRAQDLVRVYVDEFLSWAAGSGKIASFAPGDFVVNICGTCEYMLYSEPLVSYHRARYFVQRRTRVRLALIRRNSVLICEPTPAAWNGGAETHASYDVFQAEAMSPTASLEFSSLQTSPRTQLPHTPNSAMRAPGSGRPGRHADTDPNSPFVFVHDIDHNLKMKVLGLKNITVQLPHLTGRDANPTSAASAAVFWVETDIYHGRTCLTSMVTSKSRSHQWGLWMSSNIALNRFPRAARLCFTAYCRMSSDKKKVPMGWVNLPLFDFRGYLTCCGLIDLPLWLNSRSNPTGTCAMNDHSVLPLTLRVEFPAFETDVKYVDGFLSNLSFGTGGASPFSSDPLTSAHKKRLDAIIASDTVVSLSDADLLLLWTYRHMLRDQPRALSKVLLAVDWTDFAAASEALTFLGPGQWCPLSPDHAIELLEAIHPVEEVRAYAVSLLYSITDYQLSAILNQLIQVLKYEPYHDTPLARFLLQRALESPGHLGQRFYWFLQSEIEEPYVAERYGSILEAYLYGCGDQLRTITRQKDLLTRLQDVSSSVKNIAAATRNISAKSLLRSVVENTFDTWFDHDNNSLADSMSSSFGGGDLGRVQGTISLPYDPSVSVRGLIIEKCKCLDSATFPLFLVFKNADPRGRDIAVIYKAGDDLRQDMLTLQVFNLMDRLWQRSGLDMCLSVYGCMSTGESQGIIEVVGNATTCGQIHKDHGGATAALKKTPLFHWLKAKNPDEEMLATAVDNFVASSAGYVVATYVLGIGDRHNDNIMICESGHLFHIDFGKFLGNVEKFYNISRERAPFVFTNEFAYAMGGKKHPTFIRFVQMACAAYNVLRRGSDLLLSLLTLMLPTGLEELASVKDLDYVRNALALEKTDDQAAEFFRKLIHSSLKTKSTQINFLVHNLAHLRAPPE